jgi:hypothetical protein
MRHSTAPLLLLALCCAPAACEPELTRGAFDDQPRPEQDASSSEGFELGAGAGIGAMDGTWMLVHEQSNCITFAGVTEEALSVSLEIARFQTVGDRIDEEREICAINLYPVFGLDNTFPNVAAQSINPFPIDGSLVSTFERGGVYASGIEFQIYGATFEDPIGDPMPTSADDPRVEDTDGDGDPGITILVAGCRMYTVQRSLIKYFGAFRTPNQIAGRSLTRIEQSVLGTSTVICRARRDVVPNDAFARFELSRIDGQGGAPDFDDDGDGRITCDEVLERQALVWNYREPSRANCTN